MQKFRRNAITYLVKMRLGKRGIGWQYILGMIIALIGLGMVIYVALKGRAVASGWAEWLKSRFV